MEEATPCHGEHPLLTLAANRHAAGSHRVTTLNRQVRCLVVKQLFCFNSSDLTQRQNWWRLKRKPCPSDQERMSNSLAMLKSA
jgi:hypothetical protein